MEVRKHDGLKLPLHIWGIKEVTVGRTRRFFFLLLIVLIRFSSIARSDLGPMILRSNNEYGNWHKIRSSSLANRRIAAEHFCSD